MKNLTIIVPAYNEEKRIKPFLIKLIKFVKGIKDKEILIINDGSTDRTEIIIKSIIKKERDIQLYNYKKNKGKGAAIKTGIELSSGKNIIFIDADGAISPEIIKNVISRLIAFDLVLGDRMHKDSKTERSFLRMELSKIYRAYSKILFEIDYDVAVGIKGFKRKIAGELFKNLKNERWGFDAEILWKAKNKGYTITSIPIIWKEKSGSKLSLIAMVETFLKLLIFRVNKK